MAWQLLIVFVISMACLFFVKKEKIWLAIWGYYVVTAPPCNRHHPAGHTSHVRQVYLSAQPRAIRDHRSVCALISRKANTKTRGLIVKLAGAVIIVSLSFLTVKQTGIWKNGITLWSNVIEQSPEAPDGYFAYLNRGELFFKGRAA